MLSCVRGAPPRSGRQNRNPPPGRGATGSTTSSSARGRHPPGRCQARLRHRPPRVRLPAGVGRRLRRLSPREPVRDQLPHAGPARRVARLVRRPRRRRGRPRGRRSLRPRRVRPRGLAPVVDHMTRVRVSDLGAGAQAQIVAAIGRHPAAPVTAPTIASPDLRCVVGRASAGSRRSDQPVPLPRLRARTPRLRPGGNVTPTTPTISESRPPVSSPRPCDVVRLARALFAARVVRRADDPSLSATPGRTHPA